eukprot:16220947-Heterocapsa_arctica.AAC.2
MKGRLRCTERRQGIIIMYPWDKHCACYDENDDLINDLSLCDTKKFRDYLKVEEDIIYDLPTDGYST